MKKQAAMIAICASLLMCVAAAGCTSSTSPSPSAAATANSSSRAATASANVTVAPAATATPTAKASSGRVATKLIDIQSSKTGDLYLGDQVVTTGRLVDANGNGIPNQPVTFRAIASVPVLGSNDVSQGSVTTDSSGAFSKVNPVSANGALPVISTITVTGWIEYAGNDVYLPTSSPHVPVTVHLTERPSS
jgi:hypothetical protein